MHDKRTRVHLPLLLRSRLQFERLALRSAACRRPTGRRLLDPASDVDSPRSAHMAIDDMSDGNGPTSPVSSDGRVRPPKARPNLYDLLRQIESSNDDVSQRVAQAACDSDTSGSDHAVDDESGRTRRCRCVANL